MKTSHMRLLVLAIGFIATTSLWGQKLKPQHNPKYGNDSISRMQCASNLSAMSEYVKIKVYDYAYDPWKECIKDCPGASKNVYMFYKPCCPSFLVSLKDLRSEALSEGRGSIQLPQCSKVMQNGPRHSKL